MLLSHLTIWVSLATTVCWQVAAHSFRLQTWRQLLMTMYKYGDLLWCLHFILQIDFCNNLDMVQVSLGTAFAHKLQQDIAQLSQSVKPAFTGSARFKGCKQLIGAFKQSELYLLASALDGSAGETFKQMWESSSLAGDLEDLFAQCDEGRRTGWGKEACEASPLPIGIKEGE